jgi:hypothetical protein
MLKKIPHDVVVGSDVLPNGQSSSPDDGYHCLIEIASWGNTDCVLIKEIDELWEECLSE